MSPTAKAAIVMLLFAVSSAFAAFYVDSNGIGHCTGNNAIVTSSKWCKNCINPAQTASYADCRQCCIQMAGPAGSPANDQCRLGNGC